MEENNSSSHFEGEAEQNASTGGIAGVPTKLSLETECRILLQTDDLCTFLRHTPFGPASESVVLWPETPLYGDAKEGVSFAHAT